MVALPTIGMIISKIMLNFFMILNTNQKLVLTNKQILEVFPQGVIIESLNPESQKVIMEFINKVAKQEILRNDVSSNKLPNLDEKVQIRNIKVGLKQGKEEMKTSDFGLRELLDYHSEYIDHYSQNIESEIELIPKLCQSQISNNGGVDCKSSENEVSEPGTFFRIKTVKVSWGSSDNSVMHVFMNTTHIKNLEHEQALNKCLQLMFSSASHEFRTPLNAFSNALKFLKIAFDDYKTKKLEKERINIIQKFEKFYRIGDVSVNILQNLVEDILDLAKIEAGTFKLNIENFHLKKLIDDIDYIFGFQMEQRKLKFDIEFIGISQDEVISSDIGRIKQIIMNLVSNSMKFTYKGGIKITISK
mmetsp:Transcript_31519/g.27907  ORF Transcript_31519/g.27907 Transcript_31519/m.27907 type:complete len:360 (+) Transcript_31519:733-1812(+)